MRRRPRIALLAWALAATMLPTSASAAPPSPRDEAVAPDEFLVGEHVPPPLFLWRQVLSIPSIGDRIRAVTVDPRDPDRIFVGTEEGRVLITRDAGVTWREIEVKPFVIKDRSQGLVAPGLPELGAVTPNNFFVFVDPPEYTETDRIPIPSVSDPFPVRPEFFFAGFLATSPGGSFPLLGDITRSRSNEVIPIRRIVICPGSTYEVIVATKREVHGSMDGGLTYVRIFANPGHLSIDNVVCSPTNPKHVAIATAVGLFVSRDGGLSFDQDLTAWPGQPATAVEYGPLSPDGNLRLYSASGSELFAGNPDSREGLQLIYPIKGSETAPWLPIRWIATGNKGAIWLATDDGVRVSLDAGENWETVARTLFSRQAIAQVLVGENEFGGPRIAVMLNQAALDLSGEAVSGLQDSMLYASDDLGKTWHPWFYGLSRRRFQQMTFVPATKGRPPAWYVATSGEVWTSAPVLGDARAIDEAAMAWAKELLEHTPPMGLVVQTALEHTKLSNEQVRSLAQRHRLLNWVPRFDLLFRVDQLDRARDNDTTGVLPDNQYTEALLRSGTDVRFFVQAQWELYDTMIFSEETSPRRNLLYELRRQIAFAVEDAWHERSQHLNTIAYGLSDPIQIGALRVRIEALDKMIQIWTGQWISQFEPKNQWEN